jgi:3-oxoacyl-[acyl-carrier protein] reductase
VVTGGSRGLGFAAAQALLAKGARVVLSSPNEATVLAAVERLAQSRLRPTLPCGLPPTTPILRPRPG